MRRSVSAFPLGFVITGTHLRATQRRTGLHKERPHRLTAIVAHEIQPLLLSPIGKLLLESLVDCVEPVLNRGPPPGLPPHNLFRVPSQHEDDVQPPLGLDQDLGHIHPPPLIRPMRFRLTPCGRLARP
ncbi:hypothetical protein [Nitrospira sp. M1]